MSEIVPFENTEFQKKSFWKRPEGVTGTIFLVGLLAGGGYLLFKFLPAIIELTQNILYLSGLLIVLAAIVYMILDPKMRNMIWYMYKSVMRKITGVFVQIDPIGILKSYVEDMQDNLGKMGKQIGNLRGQMRKIKTLMDDNSKSINSNMKLAAAAKQKGNEKQLMLSTRKAARLKDTNEKYDKLHKRMEILYKILDKMYKNSELLIEDTKDQVQLKEQERKAIRASHSAMKSAMSVISGDPDKRAMFDAALEHIADDVSQKIGEMERFMELSSNFMDSVDLQEGVFEEEGLALLAEWEKSNPLLLSEGGSKTIDTFDLNQPVAKKQEKSGGGESYDSLFE